MTGHNLKKLLVYVRIAPFEKSSCIGVGDGNDMHNLEMGAFDTDSWWPQCTFLPNCMNFEEKPTFSEK